MSNTVVQTNNLAINSHRNLGMIGNQQSRASARLSSGFRINSAADDAAGLAISEKMRGQIRGLDQASRNAQDGISLIQTAEGAMSTINDMVIRIRELVIQAANDTNAHDESNGNMAQSDRMQIQREINELMDEIDATAQRTQFNTRNLIDGNLEAQTVAQFHGFRPGITGGGAVANVGATQFVGMVGGFASAALALRAGAAISAAGAPIWFHVGANFGQGVFLSIESVNVAALSAVWTGGHLLSVTGALAGTMSQGFTFANLRNLDFLSAMGATGHGTVGGLTLTNGNGGGLGAGIMLERGFDINHFIPAIDFALAHVAGQRANLGAMQNRLEFTIENLDVASENLNAANSRIRDADMAAEMMRFTQSNVLQQAAISMLAQANQAPQNILQLLR